jgi:hypothetical protein
MWHVIIFCAQESRFIYARNTLLTYKSIRPSGRLSGWPALKRLLITLKVQEIKAMETIETIISNETLKKKADLLLTAIQSIQYVTDGKVMKKDLMDAGMTERDAQHILYKLCSELTEPLFEQWRGVVEAIKKLK